MDKYDEAIEYLTENPEMIMMSWALFDSRAKCLFQGVPGGKGCLTQIRNNPKICNGGAWHDEIVADDRIPKISTQIKVEDLPVFAEWQRKIRG